MVIYIKDNIKSSKNRSSEENISENDGELNWHNEFINYLVWKEIDINKIPPGPSAFSVSETPR